MDKQPALISEREVLEAQNPEILRALAMHALKRIQRYDEHFQLIHDVYAGITGEELDLNDSTIHQ